MTMTFDPPLTPSELRSILLAATRSDISPTERLIEIKRLACACEEARSAAAERGADVAAQAAAAAKIDEALAGGDDSAKVEALLALANGGGE